MPLMSQSLSDVVASTNVRVPPSSDVTSEQAGLLYAFLYQRLNDGAGTDGYYQWENSNCKRRTNFYIRNQIVIAAGSRNMSNFIDFMFLTLPPEDLLKSPGS